MIIAGAEAIENLSKLGFTFRQAEFLYLVGTHTGVFTMKHYRIFAHVAHGNATDKFMRRLLSLQFVTRLALTSKDFVIHLNNKRFYRAILIEDSRLRRGMSPGLMRQRLQYMDFIATYSDERYLATEDHKRTIIGAQFGMPNDIMPRQIYCSKDGKITTERFFPERFPMFIKETDSGVFLAIVYGEDPGNTFTCLRRFVFNNRAFFDAIPCLHFVYVSASARRQSLATQLLTDLFDSTRAVYSVELRRYFELQRRFDKRQERTFTQDDIDFWSYAIRRFDHPKYQSLYAEFCGQPAINHFSCAGPRKLFSYESFVPFTTLLDGVGDEG